MKESAKELKTAARLRLATQRIMRWAKDEIDALRSFEETNVERLLNTRTIPRLASGWKHFLAAAIMAVVLGIPMYLWEIRYLSWTGVDWWLAYYPAGKLLLHAQDPYQIPNFHNPVWALVPLLPLVLMGKTIGGIAVFFLNLFSFAFVAFRLGARLPAVLMLVLSPFMFYALYFDNIDWLVLWGLILPPPIGLFFVMLKPQVGIGVAIFWAYVAWREGGWRKLAATFGPLMVTSVITILVFGNWIRPTSDHLITGAYNQSVFPWSVPIGALILYLAMRYRSSNTSISASPFLSPYLNMGSWNMVLVGLVDNTWLMAAAFCAAWILFATQAIIPLLR